MSTTPGAGYWNVTLHDDDINLESYVKLALVLELHFEQEAAAQLVTQVSETGAATVFAGFEDDCRDIVYRLHGYGLQARLAPLESSGESWN